MRLLLDTHIFLWYVGGDQRVGGDVRKAIEDAETVYLSVVSVWEATIIPSPLTPQALNVRA